jgi:5,10-methylenetetrahydromethanopterin reductase
LRITPSAIRPASQVRAAAQAAGRDPASVEIACVLHCCLSDDEAAAASAAREMVLRYVMHPAAPRLFGEAGGAVGGDLDLRGVRELVLAGDRVGAAAQVPQQVADGFVARGGAAQCAARLAQYRAAGVDLPILFPIPVDGDWGYEQTIAAMSSAAATTEPNGRREAHR